MKVAIFIHHVVW